MLHPHHKDRLKYAKAACALGSVLTAACASAPEASPPADAAPAPPVYAINDIFGADPLTLDALLGPPALTRREGDGEYRRYDLAECALIVILYPDEKGETRAAHLDAAAPAAGEDKPDLDACLAIG